MRFSYAWSFPVIHTIQSAIAENIMLHAYFMALCFMEPELLPMEVLRCRNMDFRSFCSCDLDLDPMTFIYKLDRYFLDIHRMCKYELPTSRLSRVVSNNNANSMNLKHSSLHRE